MVWLDTGQRPGLPFELESSVILMNRRSIAAPLAADMAARDAL